MMNFFDTYDITGGSNTPPVQGAPEQSLNEEFSQVVGQLNRFWGGFRRQSQAAFEYARKDLGQVVSQAQRELSKLTEEAQRETPAGEVPASEQNAEAGPSSPRDEDASASASRTSTESQASSNGLQTFFSQLRSSLPPNVVNTVQANVPASLRQVSGNVDWVQLRSNLSTEFQRVQGITRVQAEEYLHKSEALLREAMKEAGEALSEVVKVIPPEQEGSSTPGVLWDGADVWMIPSVDSTTPGDSSVGRVKGKGSESSSRSHSLDGQRAVATRAEALLRKLKDDPDVIRIDPEEVAATKDHFEAWLKTNVDTAADGINSEAWTKKKSSLLDDSPDGLALHETKDILVPSEMTEDAFWTRYFFRVYQIEQESEKRKALLQGVLSNEEDFSWEDEEDETTPLSAATITRSVPESSATGLLRAPRPIDGRAPKDDNDKVSAPSSRGGTPVTTSPRESSEDSYDLISSANVSTSGEKPPAAVEEDADGDSDWE